MPRDQLAGGIVSERKLEWPKDEGDVRQVSEMLAPLGLRIVERDGRRVIDVKEAD